jgi:hypothetical protein
VSTFLFFTRFLPPALRFFGARQRSCNKFNGCSAWSYNASALSAYAAGNGPLEVFDYNKVLPFNLTLKVVNEEAILSLASTWDDTYFYSSVLSSESNITLKSGSDGTWPLTLYNEAPNAGYLLALWVSELNRTIPSISGFLTDTCFQFQSPILSADGDDGASVQVTFTISGIVTGSTASPLMKKIQISK